MNIRTLLTPNELLISGSILVDSDIMAQKVYALTFSIAMQKWSWRQKRVEWSLARLKTAAVGHGYAFQFCLAYWHMIFSIGQRRLHLDSTLVNDQ